MNKEKIIQACKATEALEEREFERLIEAKTDKEFIAVLKDNLYSVSEELPYEVLKEIDFDWRDFSGDNWVDLLTNQPQFHIYCDWDKLSGSDWFWLLRNREEFHIYCDWSKLNNTDWEKLLQFKPQFEKYRK